MGNSWFEPAFSVPDYDDLMEYLADKRGRIESLEDRVKNLEERLERVIKRAVYCPDAFDT